MYFTWVLLFQVVLTDGMRPAQMGDLKEDAVYRYGKYNNSIECEREAKKLNHLPALEASCIKVKSPKVPM